MSDIAVQPAAAVDQWLASFDEALDRRATSRPPPSCSPRTATGATSSPSPGTSRRSRGTDGDPRPCSTRTLARTRAAQLARRPSDAGRGRRRHRGWFTFETAVGRGTGHLRLQGRQGVDAAHHAVRAQGLRGAARARAGAKGVEHGADPDRKTWLERAPGARPRSSATRRSPTCVIVGGGQGGIALGARLRQLGVPTIIVETQRAARRLLAQALQVAVPARPGLVRPPAVHPVPRRTGRCSRPRTRSATGSRCTRKVMELNYWGSTECKSAQLRRGDAGVDRRRRARRQADITLRPKQLVLATGMSGKPNLPELPGHGRLQGRPAPLVASTRARTPTRQDGAS